MRARVAKRDRDAAWKNLILATRGGMLDWDAAL